MRGIAAEGGASAVYPLTSTVRLHLSSADFTFCQRRSRRLPTPTRRVGDQEPTQNWFRRTARSIIKYGGAQASASVLNGRWPWFTIEITSRTTAARLPTPHPARHRARGLPSSRLGIPGSPRDRGASTILPSSIPARIPRSLARPDCSCCRSALSCTSAGRTARLTALGHGDPRRRARPKVRPSICHTGTPPATSPSPISRTSAHPLRTSPLTTYSRPSRTRYFDYLDACKRGWIHSSPSR